MLMLEEALARVRPTLDLETMQLTVARAIVILVGDLNDDSEGARVEELFWQLLPTSASPTLVRSQDGISWTSPTT